MEVMCKVCGKRNEVDVPQIKPPTLGLYNHPFNNPSFDIRALSCPACKSVGGLEVIKRASDKVCIISSRGEYRALTLNHKAPFVYKGVTYPNGMSYYYSLYVPDSQLGQYLKLTAVKDIFAYACRRPDSEERLRIFIKRRMKEPWFKELLTSLSKYDKIKVISNETFIGIRDNAGHSGQNVYGQLLYEYSRA